MPRQIRIQFPGAFYHIMARGNRREDIFRDDHDRRFFLKALGEACAMTGWKVHAWVLMRNHYHLFIETPEANLVAGMAWLQNTYTRRYNVRHESWGRLFGDRYKAVLVEGEDPYHYQTLIDYIHLNPVRSRIIVPSNGQSLLDYPWSSLAGGHAWVPTKRPRWLASEAALRAFSLPDTTAGRRQFADRLDRRAVEEMAKKCGVPLLPDEVDARCSHLRRGWYWGRQAFAEKMLSLAQAALKKPGKTRNSPQAQTHGLMEAERMLAAGLAAAKLQEKDLAATPGSDPRKLALANHLWRHTTVSQSWIAQRLHMRSAANVSQQLRRLEPEVLRRGTPAALAACLKKLVPAS